MIIIYMAGIFQAEFGAGNWPLSQSKNFPNFQLKKSPKMDENSNFTLAETCDKNCHVESLPFKRKTTCSFIDNFGFAVHAAAQFSLCVPHSNSIHMRVLRR